MAELCNKTSSPYFSRFDEEVVSDNSKLQSEIEGEELRLHFTILPRCLPFPSENFQLPSEIKEQKLRLQFTILSE